MRQNDNLLCMARLLARIGLCRKLGANITMFILPISHINALRILDVASRHPKNPMLLIHINSLYILYRAVTKILRGPQDCFLNVYFPT